MKIVNVQGRKKTGKTTTVTQIIAELCRRGYTVGSVKGIHIEGFTMDVEGEDTGKHKAAGADPVTARCHNETNVMFKGKMDLAGILKHYDTDWVVIESHVDLRCPNIITGTTAEPEGDRDTSLASQLNDLTIACSGVISNELSTFRGLPVINAMTDAARLVDVIEASYNAAPTATGMVYDAGPFELIEQNTFTKVLADGTTEDGQDSMLMENTVDIHLNGRLAGSIPCSPQYISELVLGWIRAEGYIDGIDDVANLSISEDGTSADVILTDRFRDIAFAPKYPLMSVTPISWSRDWIFRLAEDFEIILPLRKQTMAAHNCRIATCSHEGSDAGLEILFRCEDIGRHSAIDKAIGWAMRNDVNLTNCILFTSGRVSRAMVQKVIRAGIPIMAGKGTISKRAVELARSYNLTLIGYAKPDSMAVFTQPEQD
ncbi:MAG: molybdopterin-guanine dinucleotide biosynthesis protein MobB [Firmicutes bacterium]|nr:molybdopterin-guanine dinucleotide biosynthesis protein MobB [Bacillota bacterium]